jgi:hypothetical protein
LLSVTVTTSNSALELLRGRVNKLDAGPPQSSGADLRLTHATSVLQQYTNTFMAERVASPALLDAADADAVVGESAFLAELSAVAPALVQGPLQQQAQVWIGMARHGGQPPSGPDLRATHQMRPSVTPWSGTLFTSSTSPLGVSMWRSYLELYRGSDLYPLPWHVWSLPADGRVAQVTGAQDWVSLIDRYPLRIDDLVYPDWGAVAIDFDGVHLCLRAVVALQGFSFASAHGLTAPGYWDVETTQWLRWVFQRPRLIEVVND